MSPRWGHRGNWSRNALKKQSLQHLEAYMGLCKRLEGKFVVHTTTISKHLMNRRKLPKLTISTHTRKKENIPTTHRIVSMYFGFKRSLSVSISCAPQTRVPKMNGPQKEPHRHRAGAALWILCRQQRRKRKWTTERTGFKQVESWPHLVAFSITMKYAHNVKYLINLTFIYSIYLEKRYVSITRKIFFLINIWKYSCHLDAHLTAAQWNLNSLCPFLRGRGNRLVYSLDSLPLAYYIPACVSVSMEKRIQRISFSCLWETWINALS